MTLNGPEPDDVIGTEDPRASFEDFVEAAADRLLTAARLAVGAERAPDLLAGVLERASRRWWWIARAGRDPEPQVLRLLARASARSDGPEPDEPARAAPATAFGPPEPAKSEWAVTATAGGSPEPGESELTAATTAGRPRAPGAGPSAGEAGPGGRRPGWSAPDLLAAVGRRRARHARRRLVAGGVAGVVVLAAAAWPVTSALRGSPRPPASHLVVTASRSPLISAVSGLGSVPGPSPFGPPVHRAAGTILRECADANNGDLSKHWQAQSVRGGPVWFVFARSPRTWGTSRPLAHGRLSAQAGVIAIRAGQRAVVRVTGPARARFRFLPGFNSNDVYTRHAGLPGLTLGGCPGVFTMFWEGYISTLSCVPLVVRALPHGRPVHIILAAHPGACPAS